MGASPFIVTLWRVLLTLDPAAWYFTGSALALLFLAARVYGFVISTPEGRGCRGWPSTPRTRVRNSFPWPAVYRSGGENHVEPNPWPYRLMTR